MYNEDYLFLEDDFTCALETTAKTGVSERFL